MRVLRTRHRDDGRKPYASINFVTCHDGFNLHDLVSYNDNWNCGAEGPTDDPGMNALRWQQKCNFLATLMLSQGVSMLLAGDELSHT